MISVLSIFFKDSENLSKILDGNFAGYNANIVQYAYEDNYAHINGVIQKPNSGTSQPSEGFVIDGSSIIFSNAPASGSDYFILTLGTTVSIGTPSDNTVAIQIDPKPLVATSSAL